MGTKVGVLENSQEQADSNGKNESKMPIKPMQPSTTSQRPNFDHIDDEDNRVVNVKRDKFINLEALKPNIDIKNLTEIFNSYATKKTFATGFFNLALVATNFAQMKSLIVPSQGRTTSWNALNIVLMTFIGLSLFLQFVLGVVLVFLAKQGEFIDENKRNTLIRSNNGATLLVLAISIINIFINVFISI